MNRFRTLAAEVREKLRAGDEAGAAALLAPLHPAEVAEILDGIDGPVRGRLFQTLAPRTAAAVLNEAGAAFTQEITRLLSDRELADLLDFLPPDDAAGCLDQLPAKQAQRIEPLLSDIQRELVRQLLQHPPHSVGRVMSSRTPVVSVDATVGDALAEIRQDPDFDTVTDVCVVTPDQTLQGIVSLRALAVTDDDVAIKTIMCVDTVCVTPDVDREEAARTIARYNFMALPVVDTNGRLLGLFTVDDALDVLVVEGTEDVLKMGAVEPGVDNAPYWSGRILTTVRRRFGWLLLLFATETLTGTVLRHFESELAAVVALSFYIPLLIGTGGNAGSQTVSTIIRGLAVREIRPNHALRVFGREAATGFVLGLLLGAVGFVRTRLWHQPTPIAATVGLTLVVVCTWANSIGAMIPLLATRLKIDPAIVSAPLIATLVDATGLFIYFEIARKVLHLPG